ncbi:GPI transamidase component [Exophiala xenobiotica]|nr:GPI transamidase component [Exophiala xenobiotica]
MALPPPETLREASQRSRVIWSYWLVILCLGLPTWYSTTSIYRAALPTETMLAGHDDIWYSIPVCLQSSAVPPNELTNLAAKIQESAKGPQGLFKFSVAAEKTCSQTLASTTVSLESGEGYEFDYSTQTATFNARYQKGDLASVPTQMAMSLQSLFLEEHASIAYLLYMNGISNDRIQAFIHSLPQELVAEIQKSANRAFKPSSNYHLTFTLFTASPAPSSWEARESLNAYIEPILHALSSTSNISVASQVQLYSSLSPLIQPQQSGMGWKLKKEDLTSFVNTAEWPLSPSIGTGPTVNFIAYVPAQKYIPLLLEDSPSNSWLVPQWGGITILNPPLIDQEDSELGLKRLPVHLDEQSLIPAFENFQTQLLQLLGVPHSSKLPLQERLKSFQRLSGLSLYVRTSSNLASLARLAQHLSSIPIPRHVLHHVEHALDRLGTFRQCFSNASPRSWSSCLHSAREAFVDSEKAFFDESMVGQVYFPDEHKVAVYLPLLGPIGVPLVVGLIRELKSLLGRRKS